MIVGVVDYGTNNIRSVVNALRCLGAEILICKNEKDLNQVDRIILPGVGSFDAGMAALRSQNLEEPLARRVIAENVLFLGICLGMQMMYETSQEGTSAGLAWIPGGICKFADHLGVKIPHMGWSSVEGNLRSRLFQGMEEVNDFYFVHSYFAPLPDGGAVIASAKANHGCDFTAAVECGNIFGVQFHPEKSQAPGLKLLENFIAHAR